MGQEGDAPCHPTAMEGLDPVVANRVNAVEAEIQQLKLQQMQDAQQAQLLQMQQQSSLATIAVLQDPWGFVPCTMSKVQEQSVIALE